MKKIKILLIAFGIILLSAVFVLGWVDTESPYLEMFDPCLIYNQPHSIKIIVKDQPLGASAIGIDTWELYREKDDSGTWISTGSGTERGGYSGSVSWAGSLDLGVKKLNFKLTASDLNGNTSTIYLNNQQIYRAAGGVITSFYGSAGIWQ